MPHTIELEKRERQMRRGKNMERDTHGESKASESERKTKGNISII